MWVGNGCGSCGPLHAMGTLEILLKNVYKWLLESRVLTKWIQLEQKGIIMWTPKSPKPSSPELAGEINKQQYTTIMYNNQ